MIKSSLLYVFIIQLAGISVGLRNFTKPARVVSEVAGSYAESMVRPGIANYNTRNRSKDINRLIDMSKVSIVSNSRSSLCIPSEGSRKDASNIPGATIKRLINLGGNPNTSLKNETDAEVSLPDINFYMERVCIGRGQLVPVETWRASYKKFFYESWLAIALVAFRWAHFFLKRLINQGDGKNRIYGVSFKNDKQQRRVATVHYFSLFYTWTIVLAAFLLLLEGVCASGEMNGIISHQSLEHQVGLGLADLVTKGSGACHLFVVSSGGNSILLDAVRRFMQDHNRCFTIVTLNYNFEKSTSFVEETKLLKEVLMKSSCWSFVLDLTHEGSFVIRFLQSSSLSHHSAVPVIMVGPSSALKTNLIGNDTFRNCLRALYLAVSDRVLKAMLAKPLLGQKDSHDSTSGQTIGASTSKIGYKNEVLKVFQRCLFCEGGNAGLRLLYQWRFAEEPPQHVAFRDESRDFNGHQFNVVGLKRMPLVNLERKWEGPVGTVKPLDSVAIRMAEIFRQKFNFSYLLREPPDGNWGLLQPNGNFTGIVGTLQHERGDFTYMLNSLPERMVAMDASRTYTDDPFIIISPMPAPLPRSLAIVRPFEGWLWACVIASCFFSGVILWLLQRGWAQISKERGMGFAHSMIYVSRMLLEDPDSGRLGSISSQMLIGWWSVGCLIILFSYQSGLIAHLTVVKNERAIDSLEDILAREGWTWGRVEYTGATYIFLSENPSRVWQEIFAKMEVLPDEVQLDKVLQGGYSLISRKFWALPDILRIKRLGLPVHRGTTEYQVFNGYSWAFRKGFPVLSTLDKIQQRLLEAGLIDLWMDQITEIMARDPSSAKPVNLELRKRESLENQGSQDARVLTTEHLQGAFFLMFIGYGISIVAMSIELLHYATASTV